MPSMERAPREDKSAELEKYANDFYGAVDSLFARRWIRSATGDDLANRYAELRLNADEITFIEPVFTDNFIDPPTAVEMFLVGMNPNIYPDADAGGVQVITESQDSGSIYITTYTVWFTGRGTAHIQVLKDTRRMPRLTDPGRQGVLLPPSELSETIFDSAAIDPSEQVALSAMIAKL